LLEPSPTSAGVGIPKGTSAVDHATNTVLAYVFGKRTDDVFKNARRCLPPLDLFMPFGYTNDWGAYSRHLNVDQHEIGKRHTQKIERKKLESENLDQAADT